MKKLLAIMSVLVMACSTTKPAVQPVAKEEAPQTEEPEQATPPQEADEAYTMVEYKGKTWSIQLPSNKNFSDVKQTATSVDVKAQNGVFSFIVQDNKDTTEALAEGVVQALFVQKQMQPSFIGDGTSNGFPAKELVYGTEKSALAIVVFGTGTHGYLLAYGGVAPQARRQMFKAAFQSIKVSDKPVAAPKTTK